MPASNRSPACLFRAGLVLLLVLGWAACLPAPRASLAQQPASAADPAQLGQVAEQLERLYAALEAYDRDAIPRDSFDPQAVVAKVGKDSAGLFTFVRDSTCWVAYQGALRGPEGVLMDRVGNSLDRSLLLAELLRTAGHTARLAHAKLPPPRPRRCEASISAITCSGELRRACSSAA